MITNLKQGNYVSLHSTDQTDKPVYRIADNIELWDEITRSQAQIAIVNIDDPNDYCQVYITELYPVKLTDKWKILINMVFTKLFRENSDLVRYWDITFIKSRLVENRYALNIAHTYVQDVDYVHEIQSLFQERTELQLFNIIESASSENTLPPPQGEVKAIYRQSKAVESGVVIEDDNGKEYYFELSRITDYQYSNGEIIFTHEGKEGIFRNDMAGKLRFALENYHNGIL